jgi:ribulose-phosphate 3-epimerase
MKKRSNILISPSILAGDFGKLAFEARRVERAGADWLHIDIMDGHFVPNMTIGPQAVAALKKAVKIPLDVHLMITHPHKYIKQFIEAGSDIVTIHVECASNVKKTLNEIKKMGCKCGIVINPDTPAEKVKKYLKDIDMVLVMSVYPGFSFQKFIPGALPKLRKIRKWINESGRKIYLQIDGGINPENAILAVESGADVLVAGGAVYGKKNIKKAINNLRI